MLKDERWMQSAETCWMAQIGRGNCVQSLPQNAKFHYGVDARFSWQAVHLVDANFWSEQARPLSAFILV